MGEWAVRYMDFVQVKFTRKTYLEKRLVFQLLFQYVDRDLPALKLTPATILYFLQDQAKAKTGNNANKCRKNLLAAWSWGRKYLDLPKENPFDVEKFPEQRKVRYVPTERDFWKVYEACNSEQDKRMLMSYLNLAARRAEVFRLTWSNDIDFFGKKVRLLTRKTKDGSWEVNWLPMTNELYNVLKEQHRETGHLTHVFVNPANDEAFTSRQHWMKQVCKRAGVKPFGFHAIRHLTASILASNDVPMIDIQTILRHKNLATTERYIHRIKKIRAALEVLSGSNQKKGNQMSNQGLVTKINR